MNVDAGGGPPPPPAMAPPCPRCSRTAKSAESERVRAGTNFANRRRVHDEPLVRVAYDRGTLRVDGPPGIERALPGLVWDPRTGCFRAAACRYAEIVTRAQDRGIPLDNRVAAARRERIVVQAPPLRPYQRDALLAWRAHGRRGVVVLPTGAGKTRIAIAAMAEAGTPTLILCPTRVLLEQWERELGRWYAGKVGIVGDGARRVEAVTVMTNESAYRHLDAHAHRFGLLVVDEAHHFARGVRTEALEMCPAPRRLGLTATPPAGPGGVEALELLLGPIVHELLVADLIGSHLADVEMETLRVRLSREERGRYDEAYLPYARMASAFRAASPAAGHASLIEAFGRTRDGRAALAGLERASAIASFPAAKREVLAVLLDRHRADRTLVFTATATDAYAIARDRLLPVITAEIGRAEREDLLEHFRDGRCKCIVSARVLNEGVDVPDARVAIIVGGRLGEREHVQRIGRVLRPGPLKRAVVYELVTIGTIDDRRATARRRGLAFAGNR